MCNIPIGLSIWWTSKLLSQINKLFIWKKNRDCSDARWKVTSYTIVIKYVLFFPLSIPYFWDWFLLFKNIVKWIKLFQKHISKTPKKNPMDFPVVNFSLRWISHAMNFQRWILSKPLSVSFFKQILPIGYSLLSIFLVTHWKNISFLYVVQKTSYLNLY